MRCIALTADVSTRLLCRMVGDPADAEELLQDVFLQAHRRLGTFRQEAALPTWLHRIAVNRCLDHLRGRRARQDAVTTSLSAEATSAPSTRPVDPVARLDLERAIRQPAGWMSSGVRAARRRGLPARRGRRAARGRGGHVEVSGAQGASSVATLDGAIREATEAGMTMATSRLVRRHSKVRTVRRVHLGSGRRGSGGGPGPRGEDRTRS